MGYRVTDTRQIPTMTQAGSKRTEYRVYIITDQGATGFIDVPAAKWNKDDLAEILSEFEAELDLPFNLGVE